VIQRFQSQLVDRDFVVQNGLGDWRTEDQGWFISGGTPSTPKDLWKFGRRLIIFAENVDCNVRHKSIWRAANMRSDSADTDDEETLLRVLDEKVSKVRRGFWSDSVNDDMLWYLGTQLTPNEADIHAWIAGNLVQGQRAFLPILAARSTPLILQRLKTEWREKPLNIVAGDYIDESFCEAVIRHNRNVRFA
jgi:hypothetical protein